MILTWVLPFVAMTPTPTPKAEHLHPVSCMMMSERKHGKQGGGFV